MEWKGDHECCVGKNMDSVGRAFFRQQLGVYRKWLKIAAKNPS
jgi:hypothetical protein